MIPVVEHSAALVVARPARPPVTGTAAERHQALCAGLLALAVTAAYYLAARAWVPAWVPSSFELAGTATSLACVALVRRQNILSMPYGLVSVVFMGAFFFQVSLVGQGWLHLGFYIPVQIWGWWMWARAGADHSELPVSTLTTSQRVAVALFVGVATIALVRIFAALHGESPRLLWDCSIVAASIAAQLLLSWKKVESWWLWLLPIDVSAVALYALSGAYLFAALYALYLYLAASGLARWHRDLVAGGALRAADRDGLSVAPATS